MTNPNTLSPEQLLESLRAEGCLIELPASLTPASVSFLCERLSLCASAEGRVIILKGSSEVFCRGMDLSVSGDVSSTMKLFADLLVDLHHTSKPTLAIVEGSVLGGGLGIMVACDAVIATPGSSFGLPEALFGLTPATIFPLLLTRLSVQKARLMALDGIARDARWAESAGLIDLLVDTPMLHSAIRSFIRRLSRAEPGAVRGLRELTRGRQELNEAIYAGARITAARLADPAIVARLRAFAEDGLGEQ
jgi:polyketide biosynthesis enoyl-CoA hydratase PksH